jgi:hypothetical protein
LVSFLAIQAASIPNGDFDLGPRPGAGTFLMLSDIHFNPFTDPGIVEQLGAKPLPECQTASPNLFSRLGSDTNYPLLKSTLENVAATAAARHIHFDYIVLTGDLLAHQFDGAYHQCVNGDAAAYTRFTVETMKLVDREISKALPRVPVFQTLGNNDSDGGDYAQPSAQFLRDVGRDWGGEWGAISAEVRDAALQEFTRAGYYAVPNPNVQNNEFIVLNSNVWVARNTSACSAGDPDPGGEFAWMDEVLSGLQRDRRTATLVMHVLPGIDALRSSVGAPQPLWTPACIQKFIGTMTHYRAVVCQIYAGHIHRDDFRILPDREGQPLVPIHVAPSVSPVYFNNPGVQVGWYDKSTGDLEDYATLYLDLGNSKTEWAEEYDFAQAYGVARPDLATLVKLGHAIHDGNPDSGVGQEYAKFYNVGVGLFLTSKNWRNYTCTQTAFTPVLFAECKNATRGR